VLEQVQQKLTTLQKQALPQNSRALFLLSAGSRGLRAAGVSTGGDALIRLMGASNVMTYNSYQPISAEAIMATNPDIIFLAADGSKNAMADFLRDYPTLSTLKAAQTQKIVEVRSETLVAGLSVLTVDEALRLQTFLQQQAVKN
jgi:iron complex transport system substrate-binding protein